MVLSKRERYMSVTDSDFQLLIKLRKRFEDQKELVLGPPPMTWHRNILSLETRDIFILDYHRGQINIEKYSYNKRFRTNIVLLRICSHGRHHNPDGSLLVGMHVHIYKDQFDDRTAFPITVLGIDSTANRDEVLIALLKFCNVENIPTIQNSL